LANFGLSDAELGTITTTGGVMVGSAGAGTITVDGNVTTHAGYSTLLSVAEMLLIMEQQLYL